MFAVNILPPVVDGTRARWGGRFDPNGDSFWFIVDDVSSSVAEQYALSDGSLLQSVTITDGIGVATDFWGHDGHGGLVYLDNDGNQSRWDISGASASVLFASPGTFTLGCFDPEGDRLITVSSNTFLGSGTAQIDACTMAGAHSVLDTFTSLGRPTGADPCTTPDGAVWWAESHTGTKLARWTSGGGYQSSSLVQQTALFPRPDGTIWCEIAGTVVDVATDVSSTTTVPCADLASIEDARNLGVGRTVGASIVAWSLEQGGDDSYDIWRLG